MECTKCKLQYASKAEAKVNLRVTKHRKNVLKLNAILLAWHFVQRDHDFNTDVKFTIIEQLQNINLKNQGNTQKA